MFCAANERERAEVDRKAIADAREASAAVASARREEGRRNSLRRHKLESEALHATIELTIEVSLASVHVAIAHA